MTTLKTLKIKMLSLNNNRKSIFFLNMFYQLSLENIEEKKYENAFKNSITISYQIERDEKSITSINPLYEYISLSYDILNKNYKYRQFFIIFL